MWAGVLVLITLLVARWITTTIRITRYKKLHACEGPVWIRQSERIVGYGLYKTQIQASKDKKILEVGRQRYLDYGNTWAARMMCKVNTFSEKLCLSWP